MRVIYVLHTTDLLQGSTKAFLNQLRGLMSFGIEPLVITPRNGELIQYLNEQGIKTNILAYRMAVYPPIKSLKDFILFLPRLLSHILLNAIASLYLYKIARNFGAELIHTNVSVIDIGYKVACWLHIPHVWHIREYGALDFNYYYYYYSRGQHLRKLHQYNSYSICITKDVQKYNTLQQEPQSRVIYDGPLSIKNIRFIKEKEPYFLYVGRLEPKKGIADLLDAYILFRQERPDSPIRLKIAGNTDDMHYYSTLKRKSQLASEFIEFLGQRRDVLDLMAKAYAQIVPSHSEGFGFTTVEAMFNGCLVIGYNKAGTKEQFDNGLELMGKEIGLRYNTQEMLVQYMCEIADIGVIHYYPMIECSQQVVSQLYTQEKNSEQIYNFYKSIISN